MKKEQLNEENKTVLMLGFLCISSLTETASLTEKVNVLDRFSLTDAEISLICACKKQAVADARLRAKKKTK
jgi:hypothetical protein